jgi:hypothetical protein
MLAKAPVMPTPRLGPELPPRTSSFSSRITEQPQRPAWIAAQQPETPDPMTKTSDG